LTGLNRVGARDISFDDQAPYTGWLFDICPQIGVAYRPHKTNRIYAAAGKKMRNPSLRELYERNKNNINKLAQPELQPEKSINYEIGLQHRLCKGTDAEFAFFYADIDNMIENNEATALYENIPAVKSLGIEGSVTTKLFMWLDAVLHYSWLSMEEDNNNDRQEMQYRPQHTTSFMLTFHLPGKTDFSIDGQFVGEQYFYAAGKRKLDPYAIFDIHIQKNAGRHVSLQLGSKNLFDAYYEESQGLPQSGRRIYCNMKVFR
jgi:outer membrane receptor protein involved in Fe transport